VAEKDRSLLLGFILYIPSAHFLLSESNTQGRKAYDADTDYHNLPEFIAHFLTSFLSIFSLAEFLPANPFTGAFYPQGMGSVKKKQKSQASLSLTGNGVSTSCLPFEWGLHHRRLFFLYSPPERCENDLVVSWLSVGPPA
jgi:hypothetical protein